MALFKKYDWWSVDDEIQKVVDYYYEGNERGSIYWDFYSDQINEMGCLAADMAEEMQQIRSRLSYQYDLPWKSLDCYEEDDAGSHTAISWWNTAACMLSDIDMEALIENESAGSRYFTENEQEREKEKRIRMLERLTKKQQMALYTEVIGFLMRWQELVAAFETITAVIRELEYHQSFLNGKDGVQEPRAAWL